MYAMHSGEKAGPTITIHAGESFMQSLVIKWDVGDAKFTEFTVEMVLDRTTGPDNGMLQPAADAVVKTVSASGFERHASVKNMPMGRHFLIAVTGKTRWGEQSRSKWKRMATLPAAEKDSDEMANLDPLHKPRMKCSECNCKRYISQGWDVHRAELACCRRCGCSYLEHELVDVGKVMRQRENRACELLDRESVTPLPEEGLEWDARECMLWFFTDGAFHPHKADVRAADRKLNGLFAGSAGRKGRVSVITPTTESRQKFHRMLWKCFEAQTWPDKELVVVETFSGKASKFLKTIAKQDDRLVLHSCYCPPGSDWSLGLKRNIGTHLATGEILANFDDDDLYAPGYLKKMVGCLQDPNCQLVKLSSWYIFNVQSERWGFCDPVTWGTCCGKDDDDKGVRSWSYGYGFSYVYRRQASLDCWFDNKSFGEDFEFVSELQRKKGPGAVQIFRDDFGSCLHVLHGANTSDSIPLRAVTQEEAQRLEVMELAPHLAGAEVEEEAAVLRQRITALGKRIKIRPVLAHMLMDEDPGFIVPTKVHHKIGDFLTTLQAIVYKECPVLSANPPWTTLGNWRVFRVPPTAPQALRDEIAGEVLGVAYLNDQAISSTGWRSMLDTAKGQLQKQDRVGLRTAELWLLPPESHVEERVYAGDWLYEDTVTVHCTCARSNDNPFVADAFEVRMIRSAGANLAQFRRILHCHLPETAEVLTELPWGEVVALRDEDEMPEKVIVTEFKGRRSFYMKFTRNQAYFFLNGMQAFLNKRGNAKRMELLYEDSNGNDRSFNTLLNPILTKEAYPALLMRLGLPAKTNEVEFVADALQPAAKSDREVTELQLRVTEGLRTWSSAKSALDALNVHRLLAGEEILTRWYEERCKWMYN